MPFDSIIWDLDDDPHGNVHHCAEHGVTKEEVEEVFQNATDADISASTGRTVVFGDTRLCLKRVQSPGRTARFHGNTSPLQGDSPLLRQSLARAGTSWWCTTRSMVTPPTA